MRLGEKGGGVSVWACLILVFLSKPSLSPSVLSSIFYRIIDKFPGEDPLLIYQIPNHF